MNKDTLLQETKNHRIWTSYSNCICLVDVYFDSHPSSAMIYPDDDGCYTAEILEVIERGPTNISVGDYVIVLERELTYV